MILFPSLIFDGLAVLMTETSISTKVIQEQLKKIQSSSLFSHSRRYPSFLAHVVQKTLDGNEADLKERTIGIEAFGRDATYDLNADPIVRVTAGEVRKRLAQYYYDTEHQKELRIELRLGSYVPEFRYETTVAPAAPSSVVANEAIVKTSILPELERAPQPINIIRSNPAEKSSFSVRHVAAWSVLCTIAFVAVVGAFMWNWGRKSLTEQFWAPVFGTHATVLISVGSVTVLPRQDHQINAQGGASYTSVGAHPLYGDPIAISDAEAISQIQRVLAVHGLATRIQSSSTTTFSDLQNGPVVLISGFNNPWTMRLTDPLRFHLVRTGLDNFTIEDRQNPAQRWSVFTLTKFTSNTRDYGLVARYFDPTTQQFTVVLAGICENGTIAASQVITDERFLAQLKQAKLMPGANQNFEAVVETQMIDGKAGPPHVVASYLW